jgi:chemotaxis protein MotB
VRLMVEAPRDPLRHLPLRKSTKPLRILGKGSESNTSNEIWLLTLSDLLMLLLIFFVVLFALPFFQQSKTLTPNPVAQTKVAQEQKALPPDVAAESRQKEVARLEDDLAVALRSDEAGEGIAVERRSQHVVLAFAEQIMFDSGQARLKESVRPVLSKVADFIARNPHLTVEIQGHTDDRPIHNKRYASNWELSADRATQVAKMLVEMGIPPAKVSTRGFAEYHPVQGNESEADRVRNRRVEIQFSLPTES